ncbi:ferritin family protein [Clostridium ihumii]|uniref:ferritin family protein n=1 Tax=Clostridium ihumii TaxID=1470356 RepID=UPI000557B4DA|nr:ferritin family protein [Clostridium ihumii]
MSYTTERQPQGNIKCYENLLREILIAELVAINDYSATIAESDMKELNHVIEHILGEEKEHYGMILHLLRKIDAEEYESYKKVVKESDFQNKSVKNEKIYEKKDRKMILKHIRDNIKGELEAIILYEELITEIPEKEGRNILHKIIIEEKEHTEELTDILIKLDKNGYGPISK